MVVADGASSDVWPTLDERPAATFDNERLEFPDGDFLDLHWTGPDHQT